MGGAIEPRSGPTRRRLTGGLLVQLGVRAVGIASGVLVAAGLARGLSHADFGVFSLALSLAAMATSLADLGVTSAAVRHVAVDPGAESETAGALVILRGAAGLAGAALVILGSWLTDTGGALLPVAAIVAASLLLGPLNALQAIGQARLRVGSVNALLLLQSVLWTAAVLILAAIHAALLTFAWTFLAVAAVQSVANWLTFKSRTRVLLAGASAQLRQLLRVAWPIGLGGLFVTAYYRLDGVLLFHFRGASPTADFSAAYRFLDVLQVVPGTLLSVLVPLLAITWRSQDDASTRRRQRLFRLALTVVLGASVPLAVGGALVSGPLVHAVYGAEFDGAGPLLAVLLAAFPAIALGYISVGLALASGRTKLYAAVTCFAATGNIAANLVLIPAFGAAAAAWTTVATEYAVAITLMALLGTRTGVNLPWRPSIRIVLATACMVAAVAPLRDGPLSWSVSAGAVTYLVAAAVFRVLTPADLKTFLSRERLDAE